MPTLRDVARWLELPDVVSMALILRLGFPVSVRALIKRVVQDAGGIDHVFVLMLENRSFDHMLGFAGVQGSDAITGQPTTAIDLSTFTLRAVARALQESSMLAMGKRRGFNFPISARALIQSIHSNVLNNTLCWSSTPAEFAIAQSEGDPGHEFDDVNTQLCGEGAGYPDRITGDYPLVNNSGFAFSYHRPQIMNCYTPDQLRVLVALSREFTLCDRWFSSMPGPTWPNRFFVHAASSGGLDYSPSPESVGWAAYVDGYDFNDGTIYDRLDARGLPWFIFHGDDFPQSSAISGLDDDRFLGYDQFEAAVNDPGFASSYTFIEPNYGNFISDFTCGNSQHPRDDVTRGEALIRHVYQSIRKSPHWYKSLLVITYDEHGGFFDHVPPPKAVPPGDGLSDSDISQHNFDFSQLGVRVPAVIISPWIPRATIDHTVYDHTSLLATVEGLYGLAPLTNRDAHANSFNHLFSLGLPRRDAPMTLPLPYNSGFPCEDDTEAASAVSALLARVQQRVPAGTPIPTALGGFLQVAFLRNYRLASAAEKPALIEEFLTIKTELDARDYMQRVRQKLAPVPLPVVFWSEKPDTTPPRVPGAGILGPDHGLTVGHTKFDQLLQVPFYCCSISTDPPLDELDLIFVVSPNPAIADIGFSSLRVDRNARYNTVTGVRVGQGIITVTAKPTQRGVSTQRFKPYSFPITVR